MAVEKHITQVNVDENGVIDEVVIDGIPFDKVTVALHIEGGMWDVYHEGTKVHAVRQFNESTSASKWYLRTDANGDHQDNLVTVS